MAEYYFNYEVGRRGLGGMFFAESAATSSEEIGNPVHYGTVRILHRLGISCDTKTAVKICKKDYAEYDMIIGMDRANIGAMLRFFGGDPDGKIRLF